ncbi:MAG TPA: hypothetical protein VFC56_17890 [Stellaceae bacterium]|nr:hypothetical protein [Stellaceae bacterium]
MTAVMPNPMNWRWRLLSHFSSNTPQSSNNDPSAVLESLEKWSFWATVAILVGIVLEAWDTIHFAKPDDTFADIVAKLIADALIGIGLLVEAICIIRAIFETRREKRESDEKIAEANARAEEARERTAQAELKLEELRRRAGPRNIDHDGFVKEIAGRPKALVDIVYVSDVSDGFWLGKQLERALIAAQWEITSTSPSPLDPGIHPDKEGGQLLSAHVAAGAQPSGITVVTSGTLDEFLKNPDDNSPQTGLARAISFSIGSVAYGMANPSVPEGTLRVIIAGRSDPTFEPRS